MLSLCHRLLRVVVLEQLLLHEGHLVCLGILGCFSVAIHLIVKCGSGLTKNGFSVQPSALGLGVGGELHSVLGLCLALLKPNYLLGSRVCEHLLVFHRVLTVDLLIFKFF